MLDGFLRNSKMRFEAEAGQDTLGCDHHTVQRPVLEIACQKEKIPAGQNGDLWQTDRILQGKIYPQQPDDPQLLHPPPQPLAAISSCGVGSRSPAILTSK